MDTLVLSASYLPITQVHWQTAVMWLLRKVVDCVDEYPEKTIRTVNWSIRMPSIVRFIRISNRKRAITFSRSNVYLRDHGICQYCGITVSLNDFTYDHVIPRVQNGKTCWDNVVVSCNTCNTRKGGRTPEQAGLRMRSKPIRPRYLPNINYFTMTYRDGMPNSWKDFLRTAVYWNTSLEED
jgi:5-methylcytosine-specific restriction endonuclease McrA